MKIQIRSTKDFYSGLMFSSIGGFFLIVARTYPMGTVSHMGPAYFPTFLGGGLSMLGLVVSVRALLLSGESVTPLVLRPLLLLLGAVLAFAFLVKPLGLVLATLAEVVISCLGGWEFRIGEVALLFLVLVAITVGIFVYGLGLPVSLWP